MSWQSLTDKFLEVSWLDFSKWDSWPNRWDSFLQVGLQFSELWRGTSLLISIVEAYSSLCFFSLFFLSFLESLWSRCKHVNVSRNLLKNALCESTFLTLGRLYLMCTTFWLVPTHSVVIQIVTATLENYEASSVEIEALDIGNGRPSDCGWRRWSNRRETLNKMHRHQSFAKSEILYWKG